MCLHDLKQLPWYFYGCKNTGFNSLINRYKEHSLKLDPRLKVLLSDFMLLVWQMPHKVASTMWFLAVPGVPGANFQGLGQGLVSQGLQV